MSLISGATEIVAPLEQDKSGPISSDYSDLLWHIRRKGFKNF